MSSEKIRVGIIGAGGWAKYGHIPALNSLDEFEIAAVSSRNMQTAEQLASSFGIARAFDDAEDLIAHPEVDLVVITAPAPEHSRLVKAAIAGGKDVYSEWPLTTTTAESEGLLALAEAKGVRHVVGLQRRFAPSARFWTDLVRQGYVGGIRGVRMSLGVDAFPPLLSAQHSWVIDPNSFVHLLPVYGGHFGDLLFSGVGSPRDLTAMTENQFPFVTIEETGERIPYTSPNAVTVIGSLDPGGLFSIHLEGGQCCPTGLQIEITGLDGALRITNPRGFENKHDNMVEGMTGASSSWSELPTPDEYDFLATDGLDASVRDVAYLYDAYAKDRRSGTCNASSFADAVRVHRLLDDITAASRTPLH